jgi:hypothetical protein
VDPHRTRDGAAARRLAEVTTHLMDVMQADPAAFEMQDSRS